MDGGRGGRWNHRRTGDHWAGEEPGGDRTGWGGGEEKAEDGERGEERW